MRPSPTFALPRWQEHSSSAEPAQQSPCPPPADGLEHQRSEHVTCAAAVGSSSSHSTADVCVGMMQLYSSRCRLVSVTKS
jgi:hypothetical protein